MQLPADALPTLADLRLAGLRVAVVTLGVLGLAELTAKTPAGVAEAVAVAVAMGLWLLVPATFVERRALRRGCDALGVGLRSGGVAALLSPLAVYQGMWTGGTIRAGAPVPIDPRHLEVVLLMAPGFVPAVFVLVGCTAFVAAAHGRPRGRVGESLLALVALPVASVLLLAYAVAGALDQLLVGERRERPC